MREDFYEYSSAPQNLKTQKVLYIIYNIMFIVGIVASVVFLYMLLLFGDLGFLWFSLFSIVFTVATFFIRKKILIYFDYTFISGEVRIIRVINGKYRRKFSIIQCKDIEQIGRTTSESFEKFYNSPNYKRKMATPNGLSANNPLYYIAGVVEGEKQLIILECDEKFLSFIAAYCGRGVVEKDYVSETKAE